jgi:succinyl-CoA synthetase beta subunit
MKIHEFQAKQVLSRYGVPVPRSKVAESVEEAVDAARELGGEVWVVKAQIHAGGRGKGGGVKVCRGLEEVRENAEKILGMQLVTKQTGPAGQKVLRVLIEEGMEIIKELYCSVLVDRTKQSVVMLASTEGGMDIEEVAANTPEKNSQNFCRSITGSASLSGIRTGLRTWNRSNQSQTSPACCKTFQFPLSNLCP